MENYEQQEPDYDKWKLIEEKYVKAQNMESCPDKASFPYPEEGDVIDEEKSVRWNREEVQRQRMAYLEEAKRLRRLRNEKITEAVDEAAAWIAEETGLTPDKAMILWAFVDQKGHAYGETFMLMYEYIPLIRELLR